MAFDMYAGDRRDQIDHHEESLFELIGTDDNQYPNLRFIWENIYEGPRIDPVVSELLVHELLHLSDVNSHTNDAKWISPIVLRLSTFFSYAYREGLTVRCSSD